MSRAAEEHRSHAPPRVACGVITISDSRTEATDDTGRIVKEVVGASGHTVEFYTVVPDEVGAIVAAVRKALGVAKVVITSGGTGLAPRDVTLEALEPLWGKRLEGFGEIFRMLSYQRIGPAAMMSRAAAGTVEGGFVACLPGSPEAARLALEEVLLPELGHIVGLLQRGHGPACSPGDHRGHGASHEGHGGEAHGRGQPREGHGAPEAGHGMRPLGELIPLQEALERAIEIARPVEELESLSLGEAIGRILGEDVVATVDVPAADRSAVDGYAIRAADTLGASPESPKEFRLREVLHAHSLPTQKVQEGTCIQVATGSLIPPGADAVVMVEFTRTAGALIHITRPIEGGKNIVARGEDIRRGQEVLRAGQVLTPGRIGAAAALGIDRLKVYRQPRVGIVVTGDEIVQPGKPLPPAGVYDVNSHTLAAIVEANGGAAVRPGHAGDTMGALRKTLEGISGLDMLVFSGGSSAGEKDLVVDLVREKGHVVFHGIAVKPGRPTLLGVVEGRPVVGMPGFPTSALTISYLLLGPIVRRMARLPPSPGKTLRAVLTEGVVSTKGRTDVVPVRLEAGRALPILKGSASITAVAPADGYILVPPEIEGISSGSEVEVFPF